MGLLYDRSLDDGNGQTRLYEIPLDGSNLHVTQYDPVNNVRHSWDTNGDLNSGVPHYTNQNVGKHDPNRH